MSTVHHTPVDDLLPDNPPPGYEPSGQPKNPHVWPSILFAYGSTAIESGGGLTLRDLFAAVAMHALLANPTARESVWCGTIAEGAYAFADAMLAKRVA